MFLLSYTIIRQQKGGLALIFAILLPFIFSVCALTFDGARLLMKRARLADALNEAALVIATNSAGKGTEEERQKNAELLERYIGAYFPQDELNFSSVTMRNSIDSATGMSVPIYDLSAKLNVKTVLPLASLAPSFDAQVGLTNSGSVRKGISDISLPGDYVFVVDFSGSMSYLSDYPDEAGKPQTRMKLLKDVVKKVTETALENEPKTTFGIVPFDTGVPVLRADPHLDEQFGCEMIMVPTADYDIDYEFWDRMMPSLPTNNALEQRIYLHHHRYNVHQEIMVKMGYASMTDYSATTGLCEPIEALELSDSRYKNLNSNPLFPVPYVCDFIAKGVRDPRGIEENLSLISAEYNRFTDIMVRNRDYTRDTYIFAYRHIDADKTIKGMFDPTNRRIWSKPDIPFKYIYANSSNTSTTTEIHAGPFSKNCTVASSSVGPGGPQRNYVVELTSDKDELEPFIEHMSHSGGTTSTLGVLSGARVLAKGTNPRKVMIVISDGDDTDLTLRDEFHKKRDEGKRLCDVIREKLPEHSINTEEVDIYFISLVGTVDDESRAKYWENYCTGPGKSFIADNYQDLINTLTAIVSAYEETGYFNNRES